jgi:ArsR family transcriptional regulator
MHVINIAPEAVFQALADGTRLRLLRLLAATGEEICLCEFVDSLGEPEYNLSRHLKLLRHAGLVSVTKEGRWVYHRLVTEPTYLGSLWELVKALPDPAKAFAADAKRFRMRMKLREDGRCRVGLQTSRRAVRVA